MGLFPKSPQQLHHASTSIRIYSPGDRFTAMDPVAEHRYPAGTRNTRQSSTAYFTHE
jgi:hypothetical protein